MTSMEPGFELGGGQNINHILDKLNQQYTTKLMLEICNVKNLTFVLLKPTSFHTLLFIFLRRDGSD